MNMNEDDTLLCPKPKTKKNFFNRASTRTKKRQANFINKILNLAHFDTHLHNRIYYSWKSRHFIALAHAHLLWPKQLCLLHSPWGGQTLAKLTFLSNWTLAYTRKKKKRERNMYEFTTRSFRKNVKRVHFYSNLVEEKNKFAFYLCTNKYFSWAWMLRERRLRGNDHFSSKKQRKKTRPSTRKNYKAKFQIKRWHPGVEDSWTPPPPLS